MNELDDDCDDDSCDECYDTGFLNDEPCANCRSPRWDEDPCHEIPDEYAEA